jgi:hypothetical protein
MRRTEQPPQDSFPSLHFFARALHTIDITDEELTYLVELVVAEIARATTLVRSPEAASLSSNALACLHDEIRIGATLLGRFPSSQRTPR